MASITKEAIVLVGIRLRFEPIMGPGPTGPVEFAHAFSVSYIATSITSITNMSKRREKLVRTTITIPSSLKEKMSKVDENWSQVIREVLIQRLEEEGEVDMAEAVILNERVRRPARKDWSSLGVINQWRRRANSW